MDDKKKSVIDKFVDTVTSAVGEAVKSAVMPTRDTEAEALANIRDAIDLYIEDMIADGEEVPEDVAPIHVAVV